MKITYHKTDAPYSTEFTGYTDNPPVFRARIGAPYIVLHPDDARALHEALAHWLRQIDRQEDR